MPIETDETVSTDNIIRGNCSDYVCDVCRTKYGWPHQIWCEKKYLTEPTCENCGYYNARKNCCAHPARKHKRTVTAG